VQVGSSEPAVDGSCLVVSLRFKASRPSGILLGERAVQQSGEAERRVGKECGVEGRVGKEVGRWSAGWAKKWGVERRVGKEGPPQRAALQTSVQCGRESKRAQVY